MGEGYDCSMTTITDPTNQGVPAHSHDEARTGRVLLHLDPKKIRATRFKNRDDRSLLLHDPKFIQLAKSIAAHGQETPIRVRPVEGAAPFHFEIVSGHRRHAACLALDASTNKGFPILALVDGAAVETRDLVLKMYRENADREDLSPYETGMMFKQWLEAEIFPTQEAISTATRQSKQNVGKYIALASLPDYVISAFRDPRVLSLRWSSELTAAAAAGAPEIEALAVDLAQRQPAPAPEAVFAELIARAPKRRARGMASVESVKTGGTLLFELSAGNGRYGIRLGEQIDERLHRKLQDDLKNWLRGWLEQQAGPSQSGASGITRDTDAAADLSSPRRSVHDDQ